MLIRIDGHGQTVIRHGIIVFEFAAFSVRGAAQKLRQLRLKQAGLIRFHARLIFEAKTVIHRYHQGSTRLQQRFSPVNLRFIRHFQGSGHHHVIECAALIRIKAALHILNIPAGAMAEAVRFQILQIFVQNGHVLHPSAVKAG